MLNPLDLTEKIILVTGASSGIGREISILLSELGARVILVSRNEESLQTTKMLLKGEGHSIYAFDLTNFDAIPEWIKNISQRQGAISGLVHSAGVQKTQPLRFTTISDINQTFSINVISAIALAKGLRQKNVCEKGSSLVFLSSVAGIVGDIGISVYSASKGALIALTKSLALELIKDAIRVNCIAPAIIQTEMTKRWTADLTEDQINANIANSPLGIGMPRDVANAAAFLLADTARWITGTTLVVDGGYTAR